MNLSITTANGKHGMAEKKPMKRGQGKRQFFACLDRIQELAGKGYSPLLIHEALTKDGSITLSYAGFYDLLTQRKRRKKQGAQLAKPEITPLFPISPPTQPASKVRIVAEDQNQQPVSNAPIKPVVPTSQSSGIGTDAIGKEERRRAIQDSLSKNLKASEKFINESASESNAEHDEMAERLI